MHRLANHPRPVGGLTDSGSKLISRDRPCRPTPDAPSSTSSQLLPIMLQASSEQKPRAGLGQFLIKNAGLACLRFVCRLLLGAIFAGGLFVASIGEVRSQPSEPSSTSLERKTSVIGNRSVDEAMRALKDKPGSSVTITKPDSWVIINEAGPLSTQWSFTPAGHYAHPAVVRRAIKCRQRCRLHRDNGLMRSAESVLR
jgi:hypothetical protein